jgi:ornithine cyclodeaminase/alanine dehydrogenase-like protein (mu-crystallin family)
MSELIVYVSALRGVGVGVDAVGAELGEVLAGTRPGRTSAEQITIFAGVGLAFQDAIAAWRVYAAARERRVGTELSFLD